MRVKKLHISRWRNLEGLELEIPDDARLISLVGSNGSGKTSLLELLSFCAAQFGLAAGVRSQLRQIPPADAEFSVTLTVSDGIEIPADLLTAHLGPEATDIFSSWDRTLTLWHLATVPVTPLPGVPQGQPGDFVLAGGIEAAQALAAGSAVVQAVHQRLELNHLFLDADRSFGASGLTDDQILAASREDFDEPSRVRQKAAEAMPNMYSEWLRDSLGLEHRHAAQFTQAHREAVLRGEAGPAWTDPWESYRQAVRAILPHLRFERPEQDRRTLVFDSNGRSVPYHELSGGEREVAFLAGQILRFGLRRGLLLLDEPELHLNAELLERWLRWATETVTEGQVWIGTHSLEAVEAAGAENALVLERDGDDGRVRTINRLSERPLMRTLSGALGAPAFSLDRQRFILIEGERPGRERTRFSALCPGLDNLFLEAGNCRQVIRKMALITDLAQESDRLHIGAIIDRDHLNARQIQRYRGEAPVHVLGVHEVENFFLVPAALEIFAERNGDDPAQIQDVLRSIADSFAGLWISERAALQNDIDLGKALRERARQIAWTQILDERESIADGLSQLAELGDEDLRPKVRVWLETAIEKYRELRETEELWMKCSGKQVLSMLPPRLGIASRDHLERQVIKLLADGTIPTPEPLIELRGYVDGLSAAAAA